MWRNPDQAETPKRVIRTDQLVMMRQYTVLLAMPRVIYSAACHAQSNNDQIYIEVGKLYGQPVKVLSDTGCTGIGV